VGKLRVLKTNRRAGEARTPAPNVAKPADVVAAIFTRKWEATEKPRADETQHDYYIRGLGWLGTVEGAKALEDSIREALTLLNA
jgi:hypothetical protein